MSGNLPAGLHLATNGTISGTPSLAGTFAFTLKVEAFAGGNATKPRQIAVQAPLTITSTTLPDGSEGVVYNEMLGVTGGRDPYQWRLQSGALPPGVTLSDTSCISGTPTQAGDYRFTVGVTDAAGSAAYASFTVRIIAGLTITGCVSPAAEVQRPYSSTFIAVGGRTPYSWSVAGALPQGLRLDAASRNVAGTPSQAGASSFTVRPNDSGGATATRDCTIQIAPALRILTTQLPAGLVGAEYSASIAVTGGVPPYSYIINGGSLLQGLTLAPSTGIISGSPTRAGSASVTIRVSDTLSGLADRLFMIAVSADIAVSACPASTAVVGETYASELTATNAQAPLTWSVVSGSLPAGLSLNPATGQIAGSLTMTGTSNFSIQVQDRTARTATRACSIAVSGPALTITSSAVLPTAGVGEQYSQTLTASGGQAAYQWSLASGTLPNGIALTADGVLQGAATMAGSFTFVAEVMDHSGLQATQSFQLDVGSPVTPQVTISNLPSTVDPAQQLPITLNTDPAAVAINGTVSVSFTPDSDLRVDDPAIQFSTGGRTFPFTIAAGQSSSGSILLQTGTVASTGFHASGIGFSPGYARESRESGGHPRHADGDRQWHGDSRFRLRNHAPGESGHFPFSPGLRGEFQRVRCDGWAERCRSELVRQRRIGPLRQPVPSRAAFSN